MGPGAIGDAERMARLLSGLDGVDPARVCVRGSSLGGYVAIHAAATSSAIAAGDISSSDSPWPRWSKLSAAHPYPAAARAKSAWFSFRDPAPCTISIPGQGGAVSGSHNQYGRPSWLPVSLGASGLRLLMFLRTLPSEPG